MKKIEFSVTGKRIIILRDDENPQEFIDNILNGTAEEDDEYQSFDELLDDMEYGDIKWREVI